MLLGRTRRALGDLPGALSELRRALAFESTPELHFEYGRALLESGSSDEGLAELELAPTLAVASVERARVFLRRGDAERAVGPLEVAVKQAPNNAEAWLLLGNAYDRLGTAAKAEAAWRSAVKADTNLAEPHYRLGRLEHGSGAGRCGAGAAARWRRPRSPRTGVWTPDFFSQLGYAERARGTRPAAIAALKKYLTLAPSDAPARHEVEQMLGQHLALRGGEARREVFDSHFVAPALAPRPQPLRIIVGTAGHIDHGKTALVRALTGIDTDRLKEEKERGITIELGFAHLDAAGGRRRSASSTCPATSASCARWSPARAASIWSLLVVAADEGVDAADARAPRHLRAARHPARRGGADQGRPRRRRAGWRWPRRRRAALCAAPSSKARRSSPCSAKTGEGLDALEPAIGGGLRDGRGRDPTAAARCRSIACSR